MHTEAKLDWLDVRRKKHTAHWVYKGVNNVLPESICNQLILQEGRTRAAARGDLMIPKCNNEAAKGDFFVRGAICYNEVPTETRQLDTLNKFKHQLERDNVYAHRDVR